MQRSHASGCSTRPLSVRSAFRGGEPTTRSCAPPLLAGGPRPAALRSTGSGPTYRTGDLWESGEPVDLQLVLAGSRIRSGRLVMQRGTAREARLRFPGLDGTFARQIRAMKAADDVYGLLVSPQWPARKVGAFQTHIRPGEGVDIDLVRLSVAQLALWCAEHPTARVSLPFPGGGCMTGPRAREVLSPLPREVTVWTRS